MSGSTLVTGSISYSTLAGSTLYANSGTVSTLLGSTLVTGSVGVSTLTGSTFTSNVVTTSKINLNSTLVALGQSTTQTQTNFSEGSYASEYQFILDQALIDSQWVSIKALRAQKLRESDWICSVTDYVVPNKDAWIAYRQVLRDVTQQPNPFELTWPMEPSSAPVATVVPVGSDPVPSNPESSALLESFPSN